MGFATLGDVTFEASSDKLRTWIEARRSGASRWHKHDVYAAKPVKEFVGPGLDTITFDVELDADRGLVPRDELRALRKSRDLGEVLDFVVGGEPVGEFTLEELTEVWVRLDSKGVLKKARVTLKLEEYK